jgi:NAD(P)-dependent dehydrogenase (short-subunit alcohol dehydrogenase family)
MTDSCYPKSKVNNAGAVYGGPKLMEVTPEEIDATFATSVRGPILLMQATVPHMPRFGRIINISSVASKPITVEGVALYGGGKAAMDQITFAVAAEVRASSHGFIIQLYMCWASADADIQLGKHGKNITVNTVAPGITTTDILSPEAMDAFDKALTPMAKVEDRPGHPNDIADTILLLVQEKSRWITGQVRIRRPLHITPPAGLRCNTL